MSGAASPIRVLVADDDAILREIAGAMLRAAGDGSLWVATDAGMILKLVQ